MRIFIDTNILISSILFPNGKTAEVFSYILKNHTVIISTYSIEECKNVFKNKFPDDQNQIQTFLKNLKFELFKTPKKIDASRFPEIRDKNDLPIITSAILSDSDILLTGDKDFENIKITKPLLFSPNKYFDLIHKKGD